MSRKRYLGKIWLVIFLIASTVGCEQQKPRNKYEEFLFSLKEPDATKIVFLRDARYRELYGITYHIKDKYPAELVRNNLDAKLKKDFVQFLQPNSGEGKREWGRCAVLGKDRTGYVHAYDALWAPHKGKSYFIRAIYKYFTPYDVMGKRSPPLSFSPANDDLRVSITIYPYEVFAINKKPRGVSSGASKTK